MSKKYRSKRKAYRRKQRVRWIGCILLLLLIIFVILKITDGLGGLGKNPNKVLTEQPEMRVDLLTVNPYSRPGLARTETTGIVVHYIGNPGTTAQQNRDYFEGLKDSHITKASAHFVIGLDGEIIQCIPTAELAYTSNDRNWDTVSIECCHPDATGEFTAATYDSLVELSAWLCGKFGLEIDDIIRHYDVTGKACPLYFVEHEDSWDAFKKDVQAYIRKHGEKVE